MSATHPSIRPIAPRRRTPPAPTERERLCAWQKFLKTDRDWEWTDILRVLDFKLARVEAGIDGGFGGERKKRVAEIKAVRARLQCVTQNRYHQQLWAPHRKRWGDLRMKNSETSDVIEFVFTKSEDRG